MKLSFSSRTRESTEVGGGWTAVVWTARLSVGDVSQNPITGKLKGSGEVFTLYPADQGSANFLYKGPDNKYFGLCRP